MQDTEQGLLQEAVFALDQQAPALPSGSLLDVRLPLPAQAQLAVPLGALLIVVFLHVTVGEGDEAKEILRGVDLTVRRTGGPP